MGCAGKSTWGYPTGGTMPYVSEMGEVQVGRHAQAVYVHMLTRCLIA